MACYRYALVEVKWFRGFDEAPIPEMNAGLVDVAFRQSSRRAVTFG